MFDQLAQIVQQYGHEAVVDNTAIPNEQNDAVITEAGTSVFAGLQKLASEGGTEQLASLFSGKTPIDSSNPVVQQITQQLTGSLGQKFGLSSETSSNVANNMIPQILSSLVGKATNSNSSFQISDIVNAISGNSDQASSIMDTVSKYGMQFGLDQNADGKVDLNDAMELTKKGGFAGLLGKLFGK